MMEWMWFLAGGLCLAAAAAFIHPWMIIRRAFFGMPDVTVKHGDPPSEAEEELASVGLDEFRTTVPAPDGRELGVLVVRPRSGGECRGTVVFAPEYGGGMDSWRRYLWFLPRLGIRVVSMDFAGEGASAAPPGYRSWKFLSVVDVLDFAAVVRHAAVTSDPDTPLFLVGVSRGAACVTAFLEWLDSGELARRHPAFAEGMPAPEAVGAVVTDGLFSTRALVETHFDRWVRIYVPAWIHARFPSCIRSLAWWMIRCQSRWYRRSALVEISGDIAGLRRRRWLAIHGSRDSSVSLRAAMPLYDALSRVADLELWTVEGAGHNGASAAEPHEYARRIRAVLKDSIPSASLRERLVSDVGSEGAYGAGA